MWTSIERSKASSGWPLSEHHEQIELVAGEVADRAAEPRHARAQIDFEAAEAQHVVTRRLRRGTPEQRLDAGQQFARLEGFGQVVVGSEFEADDAVHRLAARRQHQQFR